MFSFVGRAWRQMGLEARIRTATFAVAAIAMLVALTLPFGVLSFLIAQRTDGEARVSARLAQERLDLRYGNLVERQAGLASNAALVAAFEAHRDAERDDAAPLLRAACQAEPAIAGAALFDLQGNVLARGCDGRVVVTGLVSVARAQAIASGRLASVLDPAPGFGVLLAHPVVQGPAHTVIGVLVTEVDLKRLLEAALAGDHAQPVELVRNGVVLMPNESGAFDASSGDAELPLRSERLPENHGLAIRVSPDPFGSHSLLPMLGLLYVLLAIALLIAIRRASTFAAHAIIEPLAPLVALAVRARESGLFGAAAASGAGSPSTPEGEHDVVRKATNAIHHGLSWLRDERSRLEDSLDKRSEEARLRERALQAASNGIVIADIRAQGHPVVYVNEAFERITGFSRGEALGRDYSLFLAGARKQPETDQVLAAIEQRQACSVTLENLRKDGTAFWNELTLAPVLDPESGLVTHYVGVMNDVTDRRQADEAVFEWLSRFDIISTLCPDGLVFFDESGALMYANPACERIFSLKVGDLNGIRIDAFYAKLAELADPDRPAPMPPASGVSVEQPLGNARRPDLIYLLRPIKRIIRQEMRSFGSDLGNTILYFRDITKESEVDRMKSEFLSVAAHELRSPIASIMGFTELLLMRRYSREKARDALETINSESRRLTDLLNDLLDLARIEARGMEGLVFAPAHLGQLVAQAVSRICVPRSGRTIDVDLPSPGPLVDVCEPKFQQIIGNVISNAFKFSEPGAPVEIRLAEGSDGRIGVSIRDHGIGMNAEDLAKAFDRFFRADRSGHIPGTGLGLPLVKELVQLHGGEVSMQSEPGKGTVVNLLFRRADHEPESVAHEAAVATAGQAERATAD